VKAGFAAARAAGRVAAKAGQSVNRLLKRCNSFAPETGVLMAEVRRSLSVMSRLANSLLLRIR
jgi:hypothetical protein